MRNATIDHGYPTDTDSPRKKHRYFLWTFLIVQAVMLIWMIVGINSGTNGHCSGNLSAEDCANAQQVGTAIGAGVILAVWAAVDIILGFCYLIYKVARR